MSPKESIPTPAELKTLVDDLCRHLVTLGNEAADGQTRAMIDEFKTSFEEATRDLETAHAEAEAEFNREETNAQGKQDERDEPRPDPSPTQEDVLTLGRALGSQIVERYGFSAPKTTQPIQELEVWEITSSQFERGGEKSTAPVNPSPNKEDSKKTLVSRPQPKEPAAEPEKQEVWDISSGEWHSQDS